jgi:hypothetical protein
MDPILVATSTSFMIPMTYAAYNQYWYIYSTFLLQLIVSITYHSSKDSTILIMDQLSITHLILVSIKTGYELNLSHLSSIGLAWLIYIYLYGHYTKTLAFSPSYVVSSSSHGTIHLLVSGIWIYGIYVKQLQDAHKHVL